MSVSSGSLNEVDQIKKKLKSNYSDSSENGENLSIKFELQRNLHLHHGVAIVTGIIIGSGIFVSPVGILKETKSIGFAFLMWIICGFFNMLCALCYAELGTTIPESGGDYIYIRRAFGETAAFVALWIHFIIVCPVTIAACSLIFSMYVLQPIVPDCVVPEMSLNLIAAGVTSKVHCVILLHVFKFGGYIHLHVILMSV